MRKLLISFLISLIAFELTPIEASGAANQQTCGEKTSSQKTSLITTGDVLKIYIDIYSPNRTYCFYLSASRNEHFVTHDLAIKSYTNTTNGVLIHFREPQIFPLNALEKPIATLKSSISQKRLKFSLCRKIFPILEWPGKFQNSSH